MSKTDLAIVVPVYNEEVSVGKVLQEWNDVLSQTNINYCFYVVNDGSRDNTAAVLESFKNKHPNLTKIITQANQGHGQACINGYRAALADNIDWIFQIDSDGQCDPQYFQDLWKRKSPKIAAFGHRVSRDDGQIRMYVSKVLSTAIFFGMGVWVKDSNIPYRLIHRDLIQKHIHKIPKTFFLANALFTALLVKYDGISWSPIHFRDRFGGSPSLKGFQLFKRGASIFGDFFAYREPSSDPAAK